MIITWLEDFVSEFSDDVRDEVGIGVGEERHGCDQRPAVVVDDILTEFFAEFAQDALLVEELTLVTVLEVLSDSLSHLARQFAVRHILFYLLHLCTNNIMFF